MNKKDQQFHFVWLVNGKSNWQNNEIRYSLRSVEKFHPEAFISVVGVCPNFYTGHFVSHIDKSSNPYVNQWRKLLACCLNSEISDPFIYMDDDFFLLSKLQYMTHYAGQGTIAGKVKRNTNGAAHWISVCKNTAKNLPNDAGNYCTHTPLWIDKKSFIETTKKYNFEEGKSLVPRQIYIHEAIQTGLFDLCKLDRDVKIAYPFKIASCDKFFSTYDTLVSNGFPAKIAELYPLPSKFEV